MEFSLSTSQIIACVIVASAAAVLVNWISYLIERRHPVENKVTIRLLGSAVVAEPGDLMTIALNRQMSNDEYDCLVDTLRPVADMGIKVGIIEDASTIAVARGRQDG